MQKNFRFTASCLLASVPTFVAAAELPTVTVTAEKAAHMNQVISQGDDPAIGVPADGGSWLLSIPGVTGVRMGSHGADPVIHGMKQTQLNILLDGAFVHGGCPNRMDPPSSYASAETYDRMTVIKGVQSLVYGAGGPGGTVLFERIDPVFAAGETFKGEAGAGYVSNGKAKNGYVDLATGGDSGFARAIISAKKAENYKDGDGVEVRSGYDEKGAVLDLGYNIDAQSKLKLSLEATRTDDILYAGAGMDAPVSDHDLAKLSYENKAGALGFDAFKAEVYSSRVDHVMDNFSLRTNTLMWASVPSESDTLGGRIVGELELASALLTVGIDVQQNDRDAVRYSASAGTIPTTVAGYLWPGVSIDQLGLFAEVSDDIDAASRYTAGLRVDQIDASTSKADLDPPGMPWTANQLYTAYYGITSQPQDETNVGALLRYERDLSANTAIYTVLSRTARTADATERYMASFNSVTSQRWVGNPNLNPEIHQQLELGSTVKGKQYQFQASVYYDDVNDYILRDRAHGQTGILLSDNATIYRNVDARLYGAEAQLDYQWSERWSSVFTVAYVHATNTTDSRAIAQTPPLEGTASLEYSAGGGWMLGGRLRAVDKQTRVDDDITTGSGLDVGQTPGFAVLDLYGHNKLGKAAQISYGVDNVLDKTYAEHLNKSNAFDVTQIQVNEPGRAYWVKASVNF